MTSIGSLTTRDLTTDDLDAAFDVRSRSFGPLNPSLRGWWDNVQQESIGERRTLGVFDGERLLAHAKIRPYQQFWGGRSMPMGGIAGVVVAPDARGRGVGSHLMAAIAQRSRELGDLVSALYPATIPIYRALGWEVAGAQHRISMAPDALRTLGGRNGAKDGGSGGGKGRGKGVDVRPATESDLRILCLAQNDGYAAQRANGPRVLTEADAREEFLDDDAMSYVAEGGHVAGGHVAFEWRGEDLIVSYLSARTPEVARALWSVVGSGSSVAKKVVAYVGPDDPIHLLLPEEVAHETYLKRWMLRVLDAPKAIAARGFSPSVTISAAILLDDPLLPGNSGSWRLEVSGGRGELVAAQEARTGLRLGPNGLAALFAGASLHVLRTAGLADGGDPAEDELLDAAFAGRAAYLLEYF